MSNRLGANFNDEDTAGLRDHLSFFVLLEGNLGKEFAHGNTPAKGDEFSKHKGSLFLDPGRGGGIEIDNNVEEVRSPSYASGYCAGGSTYRKQGWEILVSSEGLNSPGLHVGSVLRKYGVGKMGGKPWGRQFWLKPRAQYSTSNSLNATRLVATTRVPSFEPLLVKLSPKWLCGKSGQIRFPHTWPAPPPPGCSSQSPCDQL